MANQHFKNAAKLKCLGVAVTNQNPIHTAIVNELNSQTACFHSVQIFPPYVLKHKMKIFRCFVLPDGCETGQIPYGKNTICKTDKRCLRREC